MKHTYGPVPSRRLGQSLDVDPIPFKTCNWNCVYCQLGRTSPLTNERRDYFPPCRLRPVPIWPDCSVRPAREPIGPPVEYDLEATVHRDAGTGALVFQLPIADRLVIMGVDHWPERGGYTILHDIDGVREMPETLREKDRRLTVTLASGTKPRLLGVTFLPGVPVRVTVQVRRDRVRVLRENVVVVDWPTDFQRLSVHGLWKTEHARIIGVGAWQSGIAINKLTLRPLSGPLETAKLRPTALTSQWELAHWVQQSGGSAYVTWDGVQTQVYGPSDNLPEQPLWVRRIEGLAGTELVAENFDRIGAAHELAYLDFGLARLAESTDAMTSSGRTVGTVDYLAPEQASADRDVGTQADIYSLGCTLFCLVVGHPTFRSSEFLSPQQVLLGHATAPVPSARATRAELPVEPRRDRLQARVASVGTDWTDEDLALLERVPGLRQLDLTRSRVTDGGCRRLNTDFPTWNCRTERRGRFSLRPGHGTLFGRAKRNSTGIGFRGAPPIGRLVRRNPA